IVTQTLTVTVKDTDVQKIVTDAQPTYTIAENGTATFNVSLAFQPTTPITVSILSQNTDAATVSPAQITFDSGNYGNPKPVTVTGVHDSNLIPNSANVQISGVNTINVGFTVTDIDHQTVKFTKSSIALDEGGSSQTFGVSLDKDPSGTVNVPIT